MTMITQSAAPIAFSGSIPTNYDRYLGPLFFEPFALDMAERVKNRSAKDILEVACGTGRVTKHIVETLPKGVSFVASDINPAMLEYAKKAIEPHPALRWQVVDAVNLPFADATFDLVLSQFGVMFYSDRREAYAETGRVLKQGGTFIFNAWDNIENNLAAQLTQEVVTEFFPVDTPAFYQMPFSYHNETVIRQDLAFAGFHDVKIDLLKLTGFAETSVAAATGLLEGTPIYTAIVERDGSLLPAMKELLAKRLSHQFGKTNLKVPLQARVVTALKPLKK
jgi:SAM-dependent methyltransferase